STLLVSDSTSTSTSTAPLKLRTFSRLATTTFAAAAATSTTNTYTVQGLIQIIIFQFLHQTVIVVQQFLLIQRRHS
ncbi:hypothetical protein EF901_16795, partial [Staphylococcus aureus]